MNETMSNHRRATAVATAVLVAGVLASLAGNLQAINLDNARPGVGAYVSAVIWPLWLFGTVELLLHTPWLSNWRDRLTKAAAMLLVASVAAWVSYWHLANVLSHYGYDVASRYAGPLAIDAAMVLAALALNRVGQARRRVQDMPRMLDKPRPMSSRDLSNLKITLDNSQGKFTPTGPATGEDIFARLTRDWAVANPVLPVPVSPAPAPQPEAAQQMSARGARMSQQDSADAHTLAGEGRRNGLSAGDISDLLAGWYGVSSRTIRRQSWWVPTMAGKLETDVV
jgi:hypothetical protein